MEDKKKQGVKKEDSYTYWVDKDKEWYKNAEKPCIAPKLVSETSQIEGIQQQQNSNKNISNWNRGGTFEHKVLTADGQLKFLKNELGASSMNNIVIKDVTDVTGDVSCVAVRGQKRPGYDLKLKLHIQTKDGKNKAQFCYTELVDYESDPEVFL